MRNLFFKPFPGLEKNCLWQFLWTWAKPTKEKLYQKKKIIGGDKMGVTRIKIDEEAMAILKSGMAIEENILTTYSYKSCNR